MPKVAIDKFSDLNFNFRVSIADAILSSVNKTRQVTSKKIVIRYGKTGKKKQNYYIYVGTVGKNDLPNGRGMVIYSNGDKYEGDFIDGAKDGIGKQSWTVNSNHLLESYNGRWVKGKPDTYGQFIHRGGAIYEGEFTYELKILRRSGKGELTLPSGDKYCGEWENDMRDGNGWIIRKVEGNLVSHLYKWKKNKMIGEAIDRVPKKKCKNTVKSFRV
jgi:hypothetical protein